MNARSSPRSTCWPAAGRLVRFPVSPAPGDRRNDGGFVFPIHPPFRSRMRERKSQCSACMNPCRVDKRSASTAHLPEPVSARRCSQVDKRSASTTHLPEPVERPPERADPCRVDKRSASTTHLPEPVERPPERADPCRVDKRSASTTHLPEPVERPPERADPCRVDKRSASTTHLPEPVERPPGGRIHVGRKRSASTAHLPEPVEREEPGERMRGGSASLTFVRWQQAGATCMR